jgi:hypothetical protein
VGQKIGFEFRENINNEQKNSPSVETERPFRLLAICKSLNVFLLPGILFIAPIETDLISFPAACISFTGKTNLQRITLSIKSTIRAFQDAESLNVL